MDFLYNLFGLCEVGGVGGVGLHFHAKGCDFFFGLLAVFINYEVGESDVGAFTGETQGDFLADAAGGTGYNCGFSFK